jgi:DNA-binding transcriptional LysR family regulator
MELRHLRYFIAAAEELNFSRAAERLGINQPPLSLQIRQLEEEIGASLFRRGARGVELTDAGKLLLEESRAILGQVETAKTDVKRRARGETGQIVIGSASGTYFHPFVPAIVREYGMQYPDIVVAPQASQTALLVARLRAGLIDVAFIWRPIGGADGLAIEPLDREDTVIVLPVGHALSGRAAVPLAALAKETFLIFPRAFHPDAYDLIISACHRVGINPAFGQEAPDIVSSIPLVAAGLGVSIVPRSVARILTDGVVYLPIEGDAPRVEIALAYRRGDPSPAVQNFVALAHRTIRATARSRSSDDAIEVETPGRPPALVDQQGRVG